ncbi:MAG TPA: hypothetical protein VGQ57_05975 [Polyangiaceae bacterium]|nr:hypothetical protein [Polyangiaceae bacterium]
MTPATSSPGTPAFFGRAPVLLSEEKRLAALLDSLRELSGALEVGLAPLPPRLSPPALVEELGQVLADHFQGAEDCLKAVAVSRRDLLPVVVDMRSDHAALSQTLVDLRLLVGDPGRWVELPRRIANLLERLAVHRESEAALLSDAAAVAKVA